jgi:ribosomal protein L11 methyltransferase
VIRLALRVRREQAEVVLAELLELAPAGVEERADGDSVEYAVYGAPGELPTLPDLRAAAGEALVQISTSETPDDWQERWKRFHAPVLIDAPAARAADARQIPPLVVRPSWATDAAQSDGAQQIVIDPGQAFGTGAHASTRQCLELLGALAASLAQGQRLVDVGTGSGVLAIAASLLGFQPVAAVDNELESVAAATENARVNDAAIDVARTDLRRASLPGLASAEVVLANLLAPLLRELACALAREGRRPAHLIAGGLLTGEADEAADHFAAVAGMSIRARRERGEWAALWLVGGDQARPGGSVAAQTLAR